MLPVHVGSNPLFGPVNSIDHCDEAGAAERYLEGNLLSRVFMLFPAVHNWFKVSQVSILASLTMHPKYPNIKAIPARK